MGVSMRRPNLYLVTWLMRVVGTSRDADGEDMEQVSDKFRFPRVDAMPQCHWLRDWTHDTGLDADL